MPVMCFVIPQHGCFFFNPSHLFNLFAFLFVELSSSTFTFAPIDPIIDDIISLISAVTELPDDPRLHSTTNFVFDPYLAYLHILHNSVASKFIMIYISRIILLPSLLTSFTRFITFQDFQILFKYIIHRF